MLSKAACAVRDKPRNRKAIFIVVYQVLDLIMFLTED